MDKARSGVDLPGHWGRGGESRSIFTVIEYGIDESESSGDDDPCEEAEPATEMPPRSAKKYRRLRLPKNC